MSKVERYLRREDTRVARVLKWASPEKGEAYRNSRTKRTLDLTAGVPATIVGTPVAAVGIVASAIEHGNPFFVQRRRRQHGGSFRVVKITTMKPGSHQNREDHRLEIEKLGDQADPRITRTGRVLRRLGVDELLQVPQVVSGQMSVVGMRAAPEDAIETMKSYHPTRFNQWEEAYEEGKPSLVSLHSAYNNHRGKNEREKYRYDLIYRNQASLGLDLLILYKHAENALSFLQKAVANIVARFYPSSRPSDQSLNPLENLPHEPPLSGSSS